VPAFQPAVIGMTPIGGATALPAATDQGTFQDFSHFQLLRSGRLTIVPGQNER